MEKKMQGAYSAYKLLYIGFIVVPILAGLDKFFNLLTHWEIYLAPNIARFLPVPVGVFMQGIGVVEIIAGIIVAIKPRVGSIIVSAWLLCSIVNIYLSQVHYDVALLDLGLLLGALALALLSKECIYPPAAKRGTSLT